MIILASSKTLQKALSEINFDEECVITAVLTSIENSTMKRLTLNGSVNGIASLWVESKEESQCIDQHNARWNWVYDAVSKLSEQPIVLNINKDSVEVILQY
jgi:hypothetical protein